MRIIQSIVLWFFFTFLLAVTIACLPAVILFHLIFDEDEMCETMTTCEVYKYTWDARTWTRCPRCCGTMQAYLPTEEEIREQCLAIQRTWSPGEEQSRRSPAYRPTTPEPHSAVCGQRRVNAREWRVT